jgi:hypothetical protein
MSFIAEVDEFRMVYDDSQHWFVIVYRAILSIASRTNFTAITASRQKQRLSLSQMMRNMVRDMMRVLTQVKEIK